MPEEKEDVKLWGWYYKLENIAGRLSVSSCVCLFLVNYGAKKAGILPQATIDIINPPLAFMCLLFVFWSGYGSLKFINKALMHLLKKILENDK